MFHRMRKHLTPSTAIAFLALVFALTGGAFAASSSNGGSPAKATASVASVHALAAKKKKTTSTRGPAGPKGATGATGPAGPAGAAGVGTVGPAGPAGPTGPAGTGTEGKEGKEGHEGKTGKEGKEGKPGVIHPGNPIGSPESLPAEATETGLWSLSGQLPIEGAQLLAQVSFTIPLAEPLSEVMVHYVTHEGKEVVTIELETRQFEVKSESTECKGSAEKPTAEPGNLCIYETDTAHSGFVSNVEAEIPAVAIANPSHAIGKHSVGASTIGAVLLFHSEGGPGVLFGSWAVTAPHAS